MRFHPKRWWCGAGLIATGLCVPLGSVLAQPPRDPPRSVETLSQPRTIRSADAPSPSIASVIDARVEPIDLASALRLAGIQNPEILLARERVVEAVADRQLAAAQLLPTINVGINFD